MSSISLSLKAFLALSLSSFLLQTSATPVNAPRSLNGAEHALRRRASLNIRATTITNTTTIDWVPLDSQVEGKVAAPPPPRSVYADNDLTPLAELQLPGARMGPPGTVPIPQVTPEYLDNVPTKNLPDPSESSKKSKRQYAGKHWYVSSNLNLQNNGGSASYSMFKAFVNNANDFSLLQTAVTKSGTNGGQSVEAGWVNYPAQIAQPHLFTWFTTDGWRTFADNIGGWNRDVKGWVQYDTQIFPGTVYTTLSVDGGAQYAITLEWLLYQGNWWLWVNDRYIGYYPGTLFSNGISGVTLQTGSDVIYYYGEIAQNEGPLTTTDMGSGEFASTGFGKSAYIRNMKYYDTGSNLVEYDAGFWDSDSARYTHDYHPNSGTTWGNYVYLGGPGAGGVVGG